MKSAVMSVKMDFVLVNFFTDVSLDRATSRIARPKFSSYYQSYPRKSSSLMNLCGKNIKNKHSQI